MNKRKMKSLSYDSKALFKLQAGYLDILPKAPCSSSGGKCHHYHQKSCYRETCCVCGRDNSINSHKMGSYKYEGNCKEVATCSACGSTASRTSHQGYDSATCTSASRCDCGGKTSGSALGHSFSSSEKYCQRSGCSAVNPDYKPPHTHNWVGYYYSYIDNSNHWKYKKCGGTGGCGEWHPEQSYKASHNVSSWGSWYNDSGEGKCKSTGSCGDCGSTIAKWKSHTMKTVYQTSTSSQHKKITKCGDCGGNETSTYESHTDSNNDGNCDKCGATVHSHTYSWKWSYIDNSSHRKWKACACGNITSDATVSHSVSSWSSWYNDSAEGKCKSTGTCRDSDGGCGSTIAKWKSHSNTISYASHNNEHHKRIERCRDCDYSSTSYESHDTSGSEEYSENGWIKKKCTKAGCGTGVLIRPDDGSAGGGEDTGKAPVISMYGSSTESSVSASMSIKGKYYGTQMSIYYNGQELTRDDNTTSISWSGAIPNTSYTISGQAWNEHGNTHETLSVTTLPTTKPPQITSHSGTAWYESITETIDGIVSFSCKNGTTALVAISTSGHSDSTTTNLSSNSGSAWFNGLKPNASYNYSITVYGMAGQSSASASGSFSTPSIGVPTISDFRVVSVTNNSISISVSTSGGRPDGFKWYVDNNHKTTTTSGSVTLTGLQPSTQYWISCEPYNGSGSGRNVGEYVYTKQASFYWTGGSGANGEYRKGDPFDRLTANEWNSFLRSLRNRYREEFGGEPAVGTVQKGQQLTAIHYNGVLSALRRCYGCGALPNEVNQRETILAEHHINSLPRALNKAITAYNPSYYVYLDDKKEYKKYIPSTYEWDEYKLGKEQNIWRFYL